MPIHIELKGTIVKEFVLSCDGLRLGLIMVLSDPHRIWRALVAGIAAGAHARDCGHYEEDYGCRGGRSSRHA